MPWVTASPWNHLMILAQCEHAGWKTHFHHQFLKVGGGGVVVGHAYAILCFFPLSPRGAKARRATSTRREKGCAECSNRWDESSVLVRYALRLSSCVPLSFPISYFLLLLLSCVLHFHLSNFSVFHVTFSSLLICQFWFCISLFLKLFVLCLPPLTSLPPSFLYALFLTCCPKPHQHSASHYSH